MRARYPVVYYGEEDDEQLSAGYFYFILVVVMRGRRTKYGIKASKMRLEEEKRLLEEIDHKIIDIAFNKLFKPGAGETPSGYREKKIK
jgi:hypothetical protein